MIYQLEQRVVQVAESVFIAPSADVIGQVQLAEQSSVWFNAVLRADAEPISVGPRTNIQDGAVLHVDPGFPLQLGEGVTVGHQAMLHGCTVGDYSLIGIHAVVLNGARIGRHCLIGAHALVPEGMDIPDGSLVLGAPAKIKRELSREQCEQLQQSAVEYVRKAAAYRQGLQEQPL